MSGRSRASRWSGCYRCWDWWSGGRDILIKWRLPRMGERGNGDGRCEGLCREGRGRDNGEELRIVSDNTGGGRSDEQCQTLYIYCIRRSRSWMHTAPVCLSWILYIYWQSLQTRGCCDQCSPTEKRVRNTVLHIYQNSTPVSQYHNSVCPVPLKSGMTIMLTTKLVQPVKCCVLCPSPVSPLYCSHANPVRSHSLNTFFTKFSRKFT